MLRFMFNERPMAAGLTGINLVQVEDKKRAVWTARLG